MKGLEPVIRKPDYRHVPLERVEWGDNPKIVDSAKEVEALLDFDFKIKRLKKRLRKLPPIYVKVLDFIYNEPLTLRKIAGKLKLPYWKLIQIKRKLYKYINRS